MCWKCRLIEECYRRQRWDALLPDIRENGYSSIFLFFAICEKMWNITVGQIFHHKYHKE